MFENFEMPHFSYLILKIDDLSWRHLCFGIKQFFLNRPFLNHILISRNSETWRTCSEMTQAERLYP